MIAFQHLLLYQIFFVILLHLKSVDNQACLNMFIIFDVNIGYYKLHLSKNDQKVKREKKMSSVVSII